VAGLNGISHELKQTANGCVCVLLLRCVSKKQQQVKHEAGLEVVVPKRLRITTKVREAHASNLRKQPDLTYFGEKNHA